MRFDILTIFPKAFDSYLDTSMIKRGRAKKLVDIRVHDLREFARDRHKKVDDRPYGGGPGMVLKVEPLIRAIRSILKRNAKNSKLKARAKIILFSATGKQFDATMAAGLARHYDRIVMICGHYEGVDERIVTVMRDAGYDLQIVSVGPYVLTGGELPAMVVLDAVSRHIPGFLGKAESLEERRLGVGLPVYTRPEVFVHKRKRYRVPGILLSGNHKKIDVWRKKRMPH